MKTSPLKLKYEYPRPSNYEKSPSRSKYRYDITGKNDQNILTQTYLTNPH